MCIDQVVGLVKDIVQILFWLIAALIACLSYRQAKKSIFQPAKNEVFKVQIDTLQSLLKNLNWKSSIEAWYDSGLATSAEISLGREFKRFAKDQFDADMASESEEKLVSVGMIVSPSASGFRLIKGPADQAEGDDEFDHEAFSWETYSWETFEVSREFQQVTDLIEHALSDPVLPLSVITKVELLRDELHKSAMRAAEDLEQTVREFPRHYPSKESLKSADLTWAHNMRKERGEELFKALIELKKAIREYLRSDELLGSK
ncbi:hypothetical protein [Ponticoccus sp. (in: a-proteobacteria)]|uniref:hypothetical protein n=1 Tax=Ponticoccus sp. (in: a-proteobacteria) TaxID=1925025 RepID=UPI003AB84008